MFSGKHILISPLNWGMGHATRCADLIYRLQKNNRITIGVSASNQTYFSLLFPQLEQVVLPSYNIRYSKTLPAWLKILLQTSQIKKVIAAEKAALKALQPIHKFDVIISDNRFGLYHPACKNYIVTHQVHIISPIFEGLANRINQNYLQVFDKILVPDFEEEQKSLAGKLSHNNLLQNKLEYLGPLSHLNLAEHQNSEKSIPLLIILSGPEPQRSMLEAEILAVCKGLEPLPLLVRGTSVASQITLQNATIINQASAQEMKNLISSAQLIVCRSGYSTLMDLAVLGKQNLILIPTPGQTEQEYLAHYWQKKIGASQLQQHQLRTKLVQEIKTRLHLAR